MAVPEFYYNTKTGQVEEGKQSSWMDLMGPYSSREEAAGALEKARARNEQADADEEKWNEWDRDDWGEEEE